MSTKDQPQLGAGRGRAHRELFAELDNIYVDAGRPPYEAIRVAVGCSPNTVTKLFTHQEIGKWDSQWQPVVKFLANRASYAVAPCEERFQSLWAAAFRESQGASPGDEPYVEAEVVPDLPVGQPGTINNHGGLIISGGSGTVNIAALGPGAQGTFHTGAST